MRYTAQKLEGFIDLVVEAVLRDLNSECENGAESGQEQRRRGDQACGTVPEENHGK